MAHASVLCSNDASHAQTLPIRSCDPKGLEQGVRNSSGWRALTVPHGQSRASPRSLSSYPSPSDLQAYAWVARPPTCVIIGVTCAQAISNGGEDSAGSTNLQPSGGTAAPSKRLWWPDRPCGEMQAADTPRQRWTPTKTVCSTTRSDLVPRNEPSTNDYTARRSALTTRDQPRTRCHASVLCCMPAPYSMLRLTPLPLRSKGPQAGRSH